MTSLILSGLRGDDDSKVAEVEHPRVVTIKRSSAPAARSHLPRSCDTIPGRNLGVCNTQATMGLIIPHITVGISYAGETGGPR